MDISKTRLYHVVPGGQRRCSCDYHSTRWISVSLSPIYWDVARRSHIGDSYTHRTHKLTYATLQDEKSIWQWSLILNSADSWLSNVFAILKIHRQTGNGLLNSLKIKFGPQRKWPEPKIYVTLSWHSHLSFRKGRVKSVINFHVIYVMKELKL